MSKAFQIISWLIGFILSLYIASLSLQLIQQRPLTIDGWVGHTRQVYTEVQDVLIATLDGETGQRGYVITGNLEYLKVYQGAHRRMEYHLARLAFLTKNNPVQQDRILELQKVLTLKFSELADTLNVLGKFGQSAAIAKVNSHVGLRRMETARHIVSQMLDEENYILVIRDHEAHVIFYKFMVCAIVVIFRDVIVFTVFWKKNSLDM